MNVVAPPGGSDIRLEIRDDGTWRVTCPPRWRRHHAVHGAAGLVAGALLGMVSVSGIAEVMTHSSWGVQVFMVGWLAPLGFIGFLLVWLGVKTLSRIWHWTIIESDGVIVRHKTVAPWGEGTEFEVPVERVESLTAAVPEARSEHLPLDLRYRASRSDEILTHQCATRVRRDELTWLVASLGPLFKGASNQPEGTT
jgi:hypothetical protein